MTLYEQSEVVKWQDSTMFIIVEKKTTTIHLPPTDSQVFQSWGVPSGVLIGRIVRNYREREDEEVKEERKKEKKKQRSSVYHDKRNE